VEFRTEGRFAHSLQHFVAAADQRIDFIAFNLSIPQAGWCVKNGALLPDRG
jgi:hypothetical protein